VIADCCLLMLCHQLYGEHQMRFQAGCLNTVVVEQEREPEAPPHSW